MRRHGVDARAVCACCGGAASPSGQPDLARGVGAPENPSRGGAVVAGRRGCRPSGWTSSSSPRGSPRPRMASDLDRQVAFRNRPLSDSGAFSLVAADALMMKVREGGRGRDCIRATTAVRRERSALGSVARPVAHTAFRSVTGARRPSWEERCGEVGLDVLAIRTRDGGGVVPPGQTGSAHGDGVIEAGRE